MKIIAVATDGPAVPGPRQGHWSYASWRRLPDDGNLYEVIDGVLYLSTPPDASHQRLRQQAARWLGDPVEAQGLGAVLTGPLEVQMPGCDPVQPDLVFVRQGSPVSVEGRRLQGAPDLIVEVLSPGSAVYDTQVKLVAYAAAEVPEYAVVDPRSRSLILHRLHDPGRYAGPWSFAERELLRFDCLPGLALRIGDLFAGPPGPSL